ncbi:MAG TPA: glycosyltransferase family 4 protein [Candidatus Limnocylindria bacterium]|nr:glycosyltransferase family 4 protein [Candidatus Limnocylindria bacterium]
MTTVHQFHPVLAPGDAMSNHVFALQARLREWGHDAHAYAVEAKPGVDAWSYRRLFRVAKPDDLVLLHFSMGHELFDQLVKLPSRKVLVYHNVTPPEFFSGVNAHSAAFAELGRRQLASLADRVELAIGVSEYNRKELEAAGFERTATVPILIDWQALEVQPDQGVLAGAATPGAKLLFVGRLSPNKRQDDLIRMLAYYRRCIEPHARLLLVGSYRDQRQYQARLGALARGLELTDAVTFTGPVTLPQLVAYYRSATVFVSLSEHEGFGVPLLESMYFDLPVVAHAAAAVPETVGDAALLLRRKDLAEAAEATALVVERPAIREELVRRGRRRVAEFSADRVAQRTREVLHL